MVMLQALQVGAIGFGLGVGGAAGFGWIDQDQLPSLRFSCLGGCWRSPRWR